MDSNSIPSEAKNMEIPVEIRTFLESLLTDANMPNLDEAMHEGMIEELYERLDKYLTSVIVDNMPPEHLDGFIRMNEEKKPKAEVEAYLREKMPDYGQVFARAFRDFRDLYLGRAAGGETAVQPENVLPEPPSAGNLPN